ncbi:MAG TPA: hypothetical protein VFL83_21480 [Anaeromyxobacter sp.]|nr:hypothetical protein [Anaeromyxobacter sp.]
MTFLVATALFVASGTAIIRVLRLDVRSPLADAALAWLVGSGWFATIAPAMRFGVGLPLSAVGAVLVTLAPVAFWGALGMRRRAAAKTADGAGPLASAPAAPPYRLPRPLWAYLPMIAYVAIVAAAVLLHGVNTPTHTDDGVRVRAFAPMLAFADEWGAEARALFVMAGPIPTFVPALGWMLGGAGDPFHPNYAVLAELVALLFLAVGLPSARGSPERGWSSAFALLSIPLFVYHCTSTYSDAVLAMRVGGGVLLALEYARSRDRRDAERAFLLLGFAALVKREGELVAAVPAALLAAQLAAERLRGRAFPWVALACAAAPVALGAVAKVAAVGLAGAFPMFRVLVVESGLSDAPAAAVHPGLRMQAAAFFFDQALFRSGNAGMIYWVLPVAIVARARALVRSGLVWSLAAVGALLAEVAASSILIVPQYTLDQSTVHRALMVASVPAALWIAAALTDAAAERDGVGERDDGGGGSAARRRRHREGRGTRP